MKDKFDYYISKDYFNLKDPKEAKKYNMYILVIGGVIIFILLFFIILWSFTNYNQLGDLLDYVEYFKENNISKFTNITLGMKIMPSYNTKRKNVFLLQPSHNVRYKFI